MYWTDYLALFFAGTIAGSFLNVIIYRLPRGMSIIKPASHCPECKISLRWYENVPVISYIIQRGRCRHCESGISIRYLTVELLCGVLFILCSILSSNAHDLIFSAGISLLLLAIIFIDFEHFVIPDSHLAATIVMTLLNQIFNDAHYIPINLFSAVIVGASLWGLRIVSKAYYRKDAFGFGDVKLGAVLAFLIGWKLAILAIFLGFFLAAIFGALLLLTQRAKLHSYLAFGPFMIFGFLISVLWGESIIHWYIHFVT